MKLIQRSDSQEGTNEKKGTGMRKRTNLHIRAAAVLMAFMMTFTSVQYPVKVYADTDQEQLLIEVEETLETETVIETEAETEIETVVETIPETEAEPEETSAPETTAPETEPEQEEKETETEIAPETVGETVIPISTEDLSDDETESVAESDTQSVQETSGESEEEPEETSSPETEPAETPQDIIGVVEPLKENKLSAQYDLANIPDPDYVTKVTIERSWRGLGSVGDSTHATPEFEIGFKDSQGRTVSATGYCLEPTWYAPGTGTYKNAGVSEIKDSKQLTKVIYYGTSALSGDNCFFAQTGNTGYTSDEQFAIIHWAAAKEFGSSEWAMETNNRGKAAVNALISYANSMPAIPDAAISFSKTSVKAKLQPSEGIQKTPEITFKADEGNSITITLPQYVTYHNADNNTSSAQSDGNTKVTIEAGTKFYFTAPADYTASNPKTWTVKAKGTYTKDIQAYLIDPGQKDTYDHYQPVICVEAFTGDREASFTVKWTEGNTSLSITKTVSTKYSAYASMVSGNSLYSHEGTSFGVYSSSVNAEADRDRILTLTTDADGTSEYENLDPSYIGSTLYVKELSAGPGYQLNTAIHQVQVAAGENDLTVENEPLYAPVIIEKHDGSTSDGLPAEGLDLTGIQFELKYYKALYNTYDEAADNSTAKVWKIQVLPETDAGGSKHYMAKLDAAHQVNSTALYQLGDKYVVPLGTLAVSEIIGAANSDYDTEDMFWEYNGSVMTGPQTVAKISEQINSNGTKTVVFTVGSSSKVDEQLELDASDYPLYGDLIITKLIKDDSRKLAGAVFQLSQNGTILKPTAENGVNGDIDTNGNFKVPASGEAYVNHIPKGAYILKEIMSPVGYKINADVQTLDIRGGKKSTVQPNTKLYIPVSVQKTDSETGKKSPQGSARFAGTVFEIIANENISNQDDINFHTGDIVATLTLDENGYANTGDRVLTEGKYILHEKTAPEGYIPAPDIPFTLAKEDADKVIEIAFPNAPKRGGMKLGKIDHDRDTNVPQGNATLAGAEFSIINRSANSVYVDADNNGTYEKEIATGEVALIVTTNAEGFAQTTAGALPYGTYEVKETKAPEGYLPNSIWTKTVVIKDNGQTVDLSGESCPEDVKRGGMKLGKIDHDRDTNVPQGNATLAGAEFDIINRSANSVFVDADGNGTYEKEIAVGAVVQTITTDADGVAQTAARALPYGTYEVKESKAPAGYLLNSNWSKTFSVSKDGERIDLSDVPCPDDVKRGSVIIRKINRETNESTNLGAAKLGGAKFDIINRSKMSVMIDKDGDDVYETEIGVGEVAFTIISNEDGIAQLNERELPYGHYEIIETEPPEGYLSPSEYPTLSYSREFDIIEDGQVADLTGTNEAVADQEIRNDIMLRKVTASGQKGMAFIPFKITSLTTGESHIIMTDKNGRYNSSKIRHTVKTNAGDDKNGDAEAGLWFGLKTDGTMVPTDDSLGALPYDTYHIEELKCETNKDMEMWEDEFTIDDDHNYQGAVVLDLYNIENERKPSIGTTASTPSGSNYASADGSVTLTDTVTYSRLAESSKYILRTTLFNKTAGEFIKDAEGKTLVTYREFTANTSYGTIKSTVTFDAAGLEGSDLVFFEEVLQAENPDGEPVAEHKDPEDTDQTIHFCNIRTTAHAEGSEINLIPSDDEVTVIDTVEYHNLQAGVKYTLSGRLMDKETGEEVRVNGNKVTASRTFVVNEPDGKINVKFTFDSSALGGKDLVVFESLSFDNHELAVHEDIEDEAQTIHVTEVQTNAYNAENEEQVAKVHDELKIIDRVTYKNLIPGKKYTVEGVMMDQETGKEISDPAGNPVKASETFTAEKADGEILLTFTFKDVTLYGKKMVAFETVYYESVKVAVHADINDESQTTWVPEIKTSAIDKTTGTNNVMAGKDAVITDTVTYKNVKPGVEYTVIGKLMDPATGKPVMVNDEEITGKTVFTPKSEHGTVKVEFKFDATTIAGTSAVVFEQLYTGSTLVGVHEDLKDELQTVFIPEIATTARDKKTGKQIANAEKETTIVDTVIYKGLTPGKEYVLNGTLVDKETGKPVKDAEGKEITGTKTFTPKESDGSEDIEFKFDGRLLAGKTVVAFENLLTEKKEVAVHTDINDTSQSVWIPKLKTSALDEATKSRNLMAGENAVIIDTVSYEGLKPGEEYMINGILMDPVTKKPLTVDGKNVTGTASFTPGNDSGTVKVEFRFDATGLDGMTVVVFEELYTDGKLIGSHKDIADEEQSLFIPEIRTEAKDKATKDHNGIRREDITIVDTVTFSNLIPGESYTIKGELMDKDTGKPLMDNGKAVVSVPVKFIPSASFGTVEITFKFKGVSLKSTAIVAFETLIYKGQTVAVHADIEDESQTVYYPEIGTTAKDNRTGEHIGAASAKVEIVDTVTYRGLTPNKKYVLKGVLMDKETNKELTDADGKPVTATKKFTPETSDGSVEMLFRFDGTLIAGKTVVAFESVLHKDKEIAAHAEIGDEEQSVYYPEIRTRARDKADDDQVIPGSGTVTITDTVNYKNLIPDKKYTVIGRLIDKETGKEATVDEKPVVSEPVTFKPESSEGEVKIDFIFDAARISGKTLVVFEEMYVGADIKEDDADKDKKKVAEHKDLDDKEQTVTVEQPDEPGGPSTPGTPGKNVPKTGDNFNIGFWTAVLLAAAAMLAGIVVFIRKKRR